VSQGLRVAALGSTLFQQDCPHCASRKSTFAVVYQWPDKLLPHVAFFLAICGVCNRGITAKSLQKDAERDHANLASFNIDYPNTQFEILEIWPTVNPSAPDGVPPNIASFFAQGAENFRAARWDAAGAMFRKTLDVATKQVAPELAKKSLFDRIDQMAKDSILTPAMRDWSHEIRLDGNGAVHDDEPETEPDALAAYKFTEAFLNYAYSLPQLVSNNRAKRAPT